MYINDHVLVPGKRKKSESEILEQFFKLFSVFPLISVKLKWKVIEYKMFLYQSVP